MKEGREKDAEQKKILDAKMEKIDNSGWWRHTRWQVHFGDRHLGNIAHASRLPDRQERELLNVKTIIISMINTAVDGWSDCRTWRAWTRISTTGFDSCAIACESGEHSGRWRRGGEMGVEVVMGIVEVGVAKTRMTVGKVLIVRRMGGVRALTAR
jgi:hypothetical protein